MSYEMRRKFKRIGSFDIQCMSWLSVFVCFSVSSAIEKDHVEASQARLERDAVVVWGVISDGK